MVSEHFSGARRFRNADRKAESPANSETNKPDANETHDFLTLGRRMRSQQGSGFHCMLPEPHIRRSTLPGDPDARWVRRAEAALRRSGFRTSLNTLLNSLMADVPRRNVGQQRNDS